MPRMKWMLWLTTVLLTSGCVATPVVPPNPSQAATDNDAVLLVSRADGSVVQQRVHIDADFCMKSVDAPDTTCFKKGSPLYSQDGNLVGYEMQEQRFSLYPTH